jgi:guanylate kinase
MTNQGIGGVDGQLFIFTGTGGSGRKTLARKVCKELGIAQVLSHTTRARRPHEVHGKDYLFATRQEFIEMDIRGEFIQVVEVDGHLYGIQRQTLEDAMRIHKLVYMVVNRYGASKLKYEFGERAVRVFIYVGKQEVRERLEGRGVDDEIIRHYLDHYTEEVMYRRECEHVFENVDLNRTAELVRATLKIHIPSLRTPEAG